ncbi:MAG TPA: hypothetical protein VIJ03_09455 [Candidatus Dormibacteraeota bacterium]
MSCRESLGSGSTKGTLQYEIYFDDDQSECIVLELTPYLPLQSGLS